MTKREIALIHQSVSDFDRWAEEARIQASRSIDDDVENEYYRLESLKSSCAASVLRNLLIDLGVE